MVFCGRTLRTLVVVSTAILSLILILGPNIPQSSTVVAADSWPVFTNDDVQVPGLPLDIDWNFSAVDRTKDSTGVSGDYKRSDNQGLAVEAKFGIGYYRDVQLAEQMQTYETNEYSLLPSNLTRLQSLPKSFDIIEADVTNATRKVLLYRTIYEDVTAIHGDGARVNRVDSHYLVSVQVTGRGFTSRDEIKQIADLLENHGIELAKRKGGLFTLTQYSPLEYLKAGGGYDPRPAGDVIAHLSDSQGGPVKGKDVLFYVEPGSTLEKVMRNGPNISLPIAQLLGSNVVALGTDTTDSGGKAYLNYLLPNLISPDTFAETLVEQQAKNGANGEISGKIIAAVVDWKTMTVEQTASVAIEFGAMARIVKITGDGRTDQFKNAYNAQYPYASWGPGRVRVERPIGYPRFDYRSVDDNFSLMPGDSLQIDGNVQVEIVWVNGDRAIARVPDQITYKDAVMSVPFVRMDLSATAYDSGFESMGDKVQNYAFGAVFDKGLDLVASVHPVAWGTKKVGGFGFSVYKSKIVNGENRRDDSIMVKIRVHSAIRVDTTNNAIQVYNIEGSPSIKTLSGTELDLAAQNTVTVSEDGSLGTPLAFNPKSDLGPWTASYKQMLSSSVSTSNGSAGGSHLTIIIAVVGGVVVVAGLSALMIIIRSKRKKVA